MGTLFNHKTLFEVDARNWRWNAEATPDIPNPPVIPGEDRCLEPLKAESQEMFGGSNTDPHQVFGCLLGHGPQFVVPKWYHIPRHDFSSLVEKLDHKSPLFHFFDKPLRHVPL